MTLIECISNLNDVENEIKEVSFLIDKISYYAGIQTSCISELETKKRFLVFKKERFEKQLEGFKKQIAAQEGDVMAEAIISNLNEKLKCKKKITGGNE